MTSKPQRYLLEGKIIEEKDWWNLEIAEHSTKYPPVVTLKKKAAGLI